MDVEPIKVLLLICRKSLVHRNLTPVAKWACLTSRSIPRPNLAHGPGATKFMAIRCSSDRKLIQWQRAVIKENR